MVFPLSVSNPFLKTRCGANELAHTIRSDDVRSC